MRQENPKDGYALLGNYLGDFQSEPHGEVTSTVFERRGIIHVYYRTVNKMALNSVTDRWFSEIIEHALAQGHSASDLHLHQSR